MPSIACLWAAIVALAWYTAVWSVSLLGWYTARNRYRIRPRSPLASSPPEQVPGVSIIRPLKGLDANLFENLESTFTQDYPKFEILLSVANENDQALSVIHDLITRYPSVDASIVIGEEVVGVNPKINNLIRPYRQAKYDIIWVLDSNVQVTHGTLARAVDALDPPEASFHPTKRKKKRRIGLVHHVPLAFTTENLLGARMEEAFLNTNHAKMYLAINAIAIDSCVIGKSNMFRRSDIDRLTGTLRPSSSSSSPASFSSEQRGLPAFARFLPEDNMIASALWHELGLRHDLSCDVSHNAIGDMDLSTYVWRRVRWIRVRKHMTFVATLLEPFTESIVVGIIGSWAVHAVMGLPVWLCFTIHFALWLLVDLDVFAKLSGDSIIRHWPFIQAWACRELLALPIWILAVTGNEVTWRGHKYRMLSNGEAQRSDERPKGRGLVREAGVDAMIG